MYLPGWSQKCCCLQGTRMVTLYVSCCCACVFTLWCFRRQRGSSPVFDKVTQLMTCVAARRRAQSRAACGLRCHSARAHLPSKVLHSAKVPAAPARLARGEGSTNQPGPRSTSVPLSSRLPSSGAGPAASQSTQPNGQPAIRPRRAPRVCAAQVKGSGPPSSRRRRPTRLRQRPKR